MDENKLIIEAKNGNKQSLNILLSENYNIVFGYAVKMTGDISLAQDITQETMMRAVLNLNKYVHKSKFSTWLIKIATNYFRDYIRKNKNIVEINEDMESDNSGPEETAVLNSQMHEIFEILNKIPYEKKAVFILKHYYGYKYEEIAEILGCPVGTVRSRLHNCINYIIGKLEERRII